MLVKRADEFLVEEVYDIRKHYYEEYVNKNGKHNKYDIKKNTPSESDSEEVKNNNLI